jgi:hypothetical protein
MEDFFHSVIFGNQGAKYPSCAKKKNQNQEKKIKQQLLIHHHITRTDSCVNIRKMFKNSTQSLI